MKKLIIHVGYPKTGTTSFQSFFEYLDNLEKITYVGKRSKASDPDVEKRDRIHFLEKSFYFEKHKEEIKSYYHKLITEAESDIVVLSDEGFSDTKYYSYFFRDGGLVADRLKYLFGEYDPCIMLLIRNQYDIIPSLYTQEYVTFSRFAHLNTFERYFNYCKSNVQKSDFKMLFYDSLIEKYISLFTKKRLFVFLFEDFVNKDTVFIKDLSNLLSINQVDTREGLYKTHKNKKIKENNIYYTQEQTIIRRYCESFVFGLLRNKFFYFIKIRFYDRPTLFRFFWKKIVMELFRYKTKVASIEVSVLNDRQRDEVELLFLDSNKKIEKIIEKDLSLYGYPVRKG